MLSYRFITKFLWLMIVSWFVQAQPASHRIVGKIRAGDIPDLGVVDRETLKKTAEDYGYGYKTTNLEELKKLTEKLNSVLKEAQSHYKLGVPDFIGIASSTVKDFLKSQDVDIAKLWAELMNKYFPTAQRNNENTIFKTKKFPDGFLQEVKSTLVEPIASAFEKTKEATKEKIDKKILKLPDDKKSALDELIARASENSNRLMVRSTGKEDTDKLANAGGNETKANVIPDWPNVIESIKEVVISYFGEKSLIQRLGAGDQTLFEEPMTPFLVQLMIGERPGGSTLLQRVTRCGVMFTEEPEGGLSRMNPDDKSKTSGITIIQASYGHNEGVVNSIVPVDTYYVDMFGNFFPVIRPKFFRLIPSKESGKLERSALHPSTWSYVPALNDEEISVLKLLANALEQYYQGPMDIEYVIDRSGQTPTVWIVQARPIVHNPNQPQPSYLKDTNIPNKISCEAIGVAGGKLRTIESDEQCIVKRTIGEALEAYQDAKTDRTKVECIIVGQHAPATSHEATTFRSELKPVVFSKDWETVENWLREQKKVIVDVQRGIIAPWENSKEALANALTPGWVSYPIPAKMSLWPRDVDSAKLEIFAKATANKLAKLVGKTKIKLDDDLGKQLKLIGQNLAYIDDCVKQLDKTDTNLDQEKKNKHALLYKQFEKAVKTQQVALGLVGEIVNGYSLATLFKELKADVQAKQALTSEIPATHDERLGQLIKLKDVALVKELGTQWADFVTKEVANATPPERDQFSQLIYTLGELDSLELWLHTIFAKAVGDENCTVKTILDDSWDNATQKFLNELAEKKKILKQTNLSAVADPNKFEKVWNDFCKNMVTYFTTTFIEGFQAAKDTGRLAALQVMIDFVAVFDNALKDMSRSKAYNIFTGTPSSAEAERIKKDKDKGFVFKLMLKKNLEVLKTWWNLYCEIDKEARKRVKYETSSVDAALTTVGYLLATDSLGQQATDFQSGSYQVSEGVIGSTALWERTTPMSLENIFTWIHQSQLAIVGFLNTKIGLDPTKTNAIPNQLKIINKGLEEELQPNPNDKLWCGTCKLLGSTLNKGILRLFYNWPQQNHSASIIVSYILATKNIEIALSFSGMNEYARWDIIADILSITSKSPCRTNLSPRCVEVIWSIKDSDVENEIDGIVALMKKASKISFAAKDTRNFYGKLNKPLVFWANYEHCGFMFSDKDLILSDSDLSAVKTIMNKLLDNKEYQEKSLQLMWRLGLYNSLESAITKNNFYKKIKIMANFLLSKDPVEGQAVLKKMIKGIKLFGFLAPVLWTLLIKKNGALEDEQIKEAIATASTGIMSTEVEVQKASMELFKALVEKEQDFSEAIDKKQFFNDAINAAYDGVDPCSFVPEESLKLFKALVKHAPLTGRRYNRVLPTAGYYLINTNKNHNVRYASLKLFEALIEKNEEDVEYYEIIHAVSSVINDQDPDIRSTALRILKTLQAQSTQILQKKDLRDTDREYFETRLEQVNENLEHATK